MRLSADLRESLRLEEQLTCVLEAAREDVGLDRLHIWAAAPEGDRLIHIAESGASREDGLSLAGMHIPLPDAGAMAEVYRSKVPLVVDEAHPLPSRLRLKLLYSKIKALRTKAFVVVPIIGGGRPLGLLVGDNKYSRSRLPVDKLHLLPVFALHIGTAVELQTRDRTLAEVLDQQAATSEILRAISSSPTDLQRVLDALTETAARLCRANDAAIQRVDGDAFKVVAHYGSIPALSGSERISLQRDTLNGRAILDRCVVHVPDVLAEPNDEFGTAKDIAARLGYRACLVVPMLWEGKGVGSIILRRIEAFPFSDRQIELLKTFADQAVIAIENTRLFNELQERNRDLTESLEQQTATSEILRVISQSPRDVQPVFEAIATNARKLCRAREGG
ncbi:MAG TPA: GAF domain-containing protein, partial [Burkholderiales bacterium]|nr:GAF domain-containing protein [Burkholderiales bacterium]